MGSIKAHSDEMIAGTGLWGHARERANAVVCYSCKVGVAYTTQSRNSSFLGDIPWPV